MFIVLVRVLYLVIRVKGFGVGRFFGEGYGGSWVGRV